MRDPNHGFDGTGSVEFKDLDEERAQFEDWLLLSKLPIDRDKYLIDGRFCLDDVIRYETLATDIERVCVRLGIPWDPALLPKLKAGFRAKNARIETLYTQKSRMIVESTYSFEIDYFGYAFPSGD
jgi:hypothetical protein